MTAGNVLPMFDPPRTKSYRAAVALAFTEVRAKHRLKPVELAEKIGVCKKTVINAESGDYDLCPVTLLRLAYEFGEDAIAPVLELYRRRYQSPKTLAERFAEVNAELAKIASEMEAA